jgi:hypothetical protein
MALRQSVVCICRDVQTAWRGGKSVSVCTCRSAAVHTRRPRKFERQRTCHRRRCGRARVGPEQLLGLARAPRGRLLWIHLRTIYDVAGVMLAWDDRLFWIDGKAQRVRVRMSRSHKLRSRLDCWTNGHTLGLILGGWRRTTAAPKQQANDTDH